MTHRSAIAGQGGGAVWTPALPTPDGAATPAAWWDADTLTAGAVATWEDLAGTNDVAQATPTARPTAVAGALNGRTVVTFDGGDYLAGTDAAMPIGDLSIFAVAICSRDLSGVADFSSVLHWGYNGPSKAVFATYAHDSAASPPVVDGFGASQYGNIAAIDDLLLAWHILDIARTGTSYVVTADASATASKTMTTATARHGANGLAVGSYNVTLTYGSKLTGSIAEVLVYPSALSAPDLSTVRSYLAAKWGITIA